LKKHRRSRTSSDLRILSSLGAIGETPLLNPLELGSLLKHQALDPIPPPAKPREAGATEPQNRARRDDGLDPAVTEAALIKLGELHGPAEVDLPDPILLLVIAGEEAFPDAEHGQREPHRVQSRPFEAGIPDACEPRARQ
jgi:hypothetical protein